jgi:hypothetical protein
MFGFGVNGSQHPPKRDIVHHRNVKILNKSSICFPKLAKGRRARKTDSAWKKGSVGRSRDVDAMLQAYLRIACRITSACTRECEEDYVKNVVAILLSKGTL